MITEEQVTELVTKQIGGSNVFLVEVRVRTGNTIRVHVDRPGGISLEECVEISRFLNGSLDREVEDYSLEVSSPGLGSPFRVIEQYRKCTGEQIDVRLKEGAGLKGMLVSVEGEGIVLEVKGARRKIPFDKIQTAREVVSFN